MAGFPWPPRHKSSQSEKGPTSLLDLTSIHALHPHYPAAFRINRVEESSAPRPGTRDHPGAVGCAAVRGHFVDKLGYLLPFP
jgi:hypothetical protein